MPKIGDRVTITIRGEAALSSTASVGEGGFFTVGGRIIEDQCENWLIESDISLAGRNRMLVPKSAYQAAKQ